MKKNYFSNSLKPIFILFLLLSCADSYEQNDYVEYERKPRYNNMNDAGNCTTKTSIAATNVHNVVIDIVFLQGDLIDDTHITSKKSSY